MRDGLPGGFRATRVASRRGGHQRCSAARRPPALPAARRPPALLCGVVATSVALRRGGHARRATVRFGLWGGGEVRSCPGQRGGQAYSRPTTGVSSNWRVRARCRPASLDVTGSRRTVTRVHRGAGQVLEHLQAIERNAASSGHIDDRPCHVLGLTGAQHAIDHVRHVCEVACLFAVAVDGRTPALDQGADEQGDDAGIG